MGSSGAGAGGGGIVSRDARVRERAAPQWCPRGPPPSGPPKSPARPHPARRTRAGGGHAGPGRRRPGGGERIRAGLSESDARLDPSDPILRRQATIAAAGPGPAIGLQRLRARAPLRAWYSCGWAASV